MEQVQIEREQVKLASLYLRLDQLREQAQDRLTKSLRDPIAGTPGSRSERDALVALHEDRLRVLDGVEDRLCFGRLDLLDSAVHYVGRIGLSDEANTPLLMDWRADAAAAFYQATPAQPLDVVRRRNIATAGREVVGIDDDVLIMDALTDETRDSVTGTDALLTALDSARTGRMRDIVATIQSEQDRIIRSELKGILVVEGGPGTGKTVVALHRVAYLLYAHRQRIERSGALIVGPNGRFLQYIDRVLPALGETGVLMQTPGELFPGINAIAEDPPKVARLKGDVRMAAVIKAAVRARQRVPAKAVTMRVDSHQVTLHPSDIESAIRRARDTGKPHNEARVTFVKDVLNRLARRMAKHLGLADDDETRLDLVADLRDSRDARREINLCWMPVTAEEFLRQLLTSQDRLSELAALLTEDEQRLLLRNPPVTQTGQTSGDFAWTISDVSLLDEAAELLGDWDPREQVRAASAAAQRAGELDYARQMLAGSSAGSMVSAEQIVDRYSATHSRAPVAERASVDRSWTFGHVVVDEAQELSAMQWRVIMRRIPSKSLTLVGDPAQTSSPAGVGNWADALRPFVSDRWRKEDLTINYRTPAKIMSAAAEVLERAGIKATPPQSVREGKYAPVVIRARSTESLPELLGDVIASDQQLLGSGTIAVLCAPAEVAELNELLSEKVGAVGVSVMSVTEAKGLEFDSVIIYEPATAIGLSVRPAEDLYVAMSRPTQRLSVLHSLDLPDVMSGLASGADHS